MKKYISLTLAASALLLSGCMSTTISSADADKLTAKVVQASFKSKGIATVDRLQQDEANRLCSAADVAGQPLNADMAQAIQDAQMKTIQWPADGKYLGDWAKGEKIAASGKGLTWKDKAGSTNGGNCYNCHQIDKAQVSYGNLGPSLYNYGKLRGVSDPAGAESKAIVEYTWGKLWNARAYSACTNMPRVGHNGILDAEQIKHVMALLLDPKSPVNAN